MKMLNKKQKSKLKYQNIVVTDVDGETAAFKDVKEAAKFFDVSVVAVYNALRFGRKVRGCAITAG